MSDTTSRNSVIQKEGIQAWPEMDMGYKACKHGFINDCSACKIASLELQLQAEVQRREEAEAIIRKLAKGPYAYDLAKEYLTKYPSAEGEDKG